MRWAALILTFIPSFAFCSFELPPLISPLFPNGSKTVKAGYEEVAGLAGYTYLNVILSSLLLSLCSSTDRERIYSETVLRFAYGIKVGQARLVVALSYLGCHASGELGRVGVGRGGAFDFGLKTEIGQGELELLTWNLISAVRYRRFALKGVEGKSYWESASRDLLLRLTLPLYGDRAGLECGLFGRSPFAGLRWKPSDKALIELKWAFGRSIKGGIRFGLKVETGRLSVGYRHMIGSLGIQSTAIDVAARLR